MNSYSQKVYYLWDLIEFSNFFFRGRGGRVNRDHPLPLTQVFPRCCACPLGVSNTLNPQSRNQSPQAFWSAFRRQERLWILEFYYRRKGLQDFCGKTMEAVTELIQSSQSKNLNIFEFSRVSPGDQPLAKEPEDSGYEIVESVAYFKIWLTAHILSVVAVLILKWIWTRYWALLCFFSDKSIPAFLIVIGYLLSSMSVLKFIIHDFPQFWWQITLFRNLFDIQCIQTLC